MKQIRYGFRICWICLLLTVLAMAMTQAQTVRVLYYSGSVTVSGKGSAKLGQQLKSSDNVKIGSSSSLQLSINGKVLKYSKPMSLKISDAITRAGTGENSVVANSARTLAGASGAGRSARTSVAGATRADGKKNMAYFDSLKTESVNTGTMRLNSEVESMTGIGDASGLIEKVSDKMKSEAIILLQPRSTAVSGGSVRFRWMRTPGVSTYALSVQNFLGEEVYRTETTDTTFVWDTPSLNPEEIYTWRLSDKENSSNSFGASFHRLPTEKQTMVMAGQEAIQEELGSDNPALPMILGSFFADNECYGQAAEMFTTGVKAGDEHAETYKELVCEQYLYNMFVPVEEAYKICSNQ
ncbi:MAG: hypothetical protein KDD67_16325 [Ignavibacteriae bacterium]|nr:hypothetical protein [Ignavibacteriota bacterium]MCB9217298.1 hypothetical protein [Ignavibacteria bacterium]